MRERSQSEIVLNGVSKASIRSLLDFIYTAKLSLSLRNVQEILAAASHLQIPIVIKAAANYLRTQMDVENVVDVVTIAETYGLHDLRQRAYRFMSENLSAFSAASVEFYRLSGTQLEHLLQSDFPTDISEHKVLSILLDWLDRQPGSMAYAHRLLKHVNFDEIHPAHLKLERRSAVSSLPRSFLSRVQSQASGRALMSHLVNSRGMEVRMHVLKVINLINLNFLL